VSFEWPDEIGELSRWALDHAIETLEKAHKGEEGDAQKALSVIRLVARMPRSSPWWGQIIDPRDSSVDVGVMMRNAFEAVGDDVDALCEGGEIRNTAKNWFTQLYVARWREGKREYYDFLGHLADPERWEAEEKKRPMTSAEAETAYGHVAGILRARSL
jgi:hypothetical protein